MTLKDQTQRSRESEITKTQLADILAGHFPDALMKEIKPHTKIMHCRKGMEIIIGGMESAGFYYLKKGTVEVSYMSRDTRIVVALIGSGHFFGESGFFDGVARIRDIRAIEDAEIHVFNAENLATMQETNPAAFAYLMMATARSINQKFRRVLDEREPLTAYADSLSTGKRTSTPDNGLANTFLQSRKGQALQNKVENFKTRFFDLSCQLQKEESVDISEDNKRIGAELFDDFNHLLDRLNTMDLDQHDTASLWQYVFKETFPYMMRSRIAERSYFKPKGYAGDFMTIEMLYNNTPDGDGKIGKLIDSWCLDSSAARAVRARRELLTQQLFIISLRKLETSDTVNIMNLACGPSRELADFISSCGFSEKINALCVDIDPDALEYTNKVFSTISHKATLSLMQENLIKWSLGRVDHDFDKQDIIYSSGLMDYLDDTLFKAMINRCYDQLNPDGVLMLGNFSPANSIRIFMDYILDWKLIHRSESDLIALFDDTPFHSNVHVIGEEQGVNLFAVATKK